MTYPKLFREESGYILEYDYKNVDNFISNTPFSTLTEIEASKPKLGIQQPLFADTPLQKPRAISVDDLDEEAPY